MSSCSNVTWLIRVWHYSCVYIYKYGRAVACFLYVYSKERHYKSETWMHHTLFVCLTHDTKDSGYTHLFTLCAVYQQYMAWNHAHTYSSRPMCSCVTEPALLVSVQLSRDDVTYEQVMWHIIESYDTNWKDMAHTNETCQVKMRHVMYEWVMSHTSLSPVTHVWVTSQACMSHVTHVNTTCRTYEWVM